MSAVANEILAAVTISRVATALTGVEPHHGRIPAPWRKTTDRNVSLCDRKGAWIDHVTGEGGGILDFVIRIRGGSRQDALQWLAIFSGIPIDNREFSPGERATWARRRGEIERNLPTAELWRRSAVSLGREILDSLKAPLLNPALPHRAEIGEIASWTLQLDRWLKMNGGELVTEYEWWRRHHPKMTAAMVDVMRTREKVERRALRRYLSMVAEASTK